MKSKRHWMVLSEALRRREAPAGSRSVARQFQSLGVFDVSRHPSTDADGQWMTYRVPGCPGPGLQIRHVQRRLSASDLVGFNNTGNVCVWPSEEVLTVLCVARRDMFAGKLVLEVGGGMTCLAGLTVAVNTSARRVLLTDGNETAVENVQHICERNRGLFGDTAVEASRLRWTEPGDVASLQEQCDVILSADCLFFDDARDSLADFIVDVLKPGGVALVVAPPRSGTLDRFELEAMRAGLLVCRMEQYGPFLDSLIHSHRSDPTFDPNLHLPVLLELRKSARGAR